jgi:tRNA(Ile)-lysidine synthetase-like protein
MNIKLDPGKYVVAVSGGVDSVVLLDMLRKLPNVKLVVAHFDHGIREDSTEDRRFVQQLAREHAVPFTFAEGKLGAGASEEQARRARYMFLQQVRKAAGARAIIMAHHQDDVIETAIINLLRGTGRRGLSSLRERDGVSRPLLHVTKRQLRAYALARNLKWREDSTNQNEAYLRNYVRRRLLPRFTIAQRRQFLEYLASIVETNQQLDVQIVNYLHIQPKHTVLNRKSFVHLPHKVALEVLASWLRQQGIRNFDRKALERLVIAAKTAKPGTVADVLQGYHIKIGRDSLALQV